MKTKSEATFPETTAGKPTFLLEGIALSEEDKLRNFDELQKLCEELEEKVVCYEQRCQYIKNQVKLSEQSKLKKKKKKSAKSKVYTPNFDSGMFELIEQDDTIPTGWRSAWRILEGFSKGGRVKVYWAPNGKYCPSLVNAINQMITILDSSEEELEIMKKTLSEEGWKPNPGLPSDWMYNKASSKETKVFVDSKFRYIKNIKSAVKELSSEYSEDELIRFLVTFVLNSVKDREEAKEEDLELKKNEKIPGSWKVGHIKNRNFKSSLFVITPEGQTLLSINKIKENIHNSADLSEQEKESFITYLCKLRNRGFRDVEKTEEKTKTKSPPRRPDPVKPSSVVVKTVVNNKGGGVGLTWESEESIPASWRIAVVTDEQFGTKKYFKDHSGSTFHGRLEALRTMIKSPHLYPQQDFQVMKKGLSVDGWEESDACPRDWLRKKKNVKNEKRASYIYLSDNFVVLDTFEKVINYMNNGGFSEDVINNFKSKNGLNWQTDPQLPPGWTFANHQTEKQGIIKRLLDPFGKICFSSAHAIRTVFETNGDCPELRSLRKYMILSDGWFETEYLPPGWMIKQKRSETGFYILNEKYDKFNTMISLKQYLLNSKHGKEAAERFEKHYKELQQPVTYCKSKQPKTNRTNKVDIPSQPSEILKPQPVEEMSDEDEDLVLSDTELEEMNLDTSFTSDAGDDINSRNQTGKGNEADDVEDMDDGSESDSEEITELVWETDPTLPSGWKVNILELTYGELRGVKLRRYRSPCDNFFGNLPEVLKFLETSGSSYTEQDRIIFSKRLCEEGWQRIDFITAGWFSKHVKGRGRQFLSPGYDVCNSTEEVEAYMREQDYSDEDVQMFLDKTRQDIAETNKTKKSENKPLVATGKNNIKVAQPKTAPSNSKPEELPPKWRFEMEEDEEVIYSDEGLKFTTRRDAVEFLIKNNFPPQVIFNLWSTLDREGWLMEKAIPAGWRQKYHPLIHDYKYVTRELTLLNSSEEAVRFIKGDAELSRKHLDSFERWVNEVRKKSPKIIWKTDLSLPNGWYLSCGLSKLTKQEILKHEGGGRFETKQAAINYMIKERHSSQDIFKIWNTLHTEGWVSDENHLPRGWKRKYMNSKKTYYYLSPMMEVVKSSTELLKIISSSSDYEPRDVEKIEQWRNR